jgi:hypothetical protein
MMDKRIRWALSLALAYAITGAHPLMRLAVFERIKRILDGSEDEYLNNHRQSMHRMRQTL